MKASKLLQFNKKLQRQLALIKILDKAVKSRRSNTVTKSHDNFILKVSLKNAQRGLAYIIAMQDDDSLNAAEKIVHKGVIIANDVSMSHWFTKLGLLQPHIYSTNDLCDCRCDAECLYGFMASELYYYMSLFKYRKPAPKHLHL